MKKFIISNILFALINSAQAFDSCKYVQSRGFFSYQKVESLKKQHRIIEHKSMNKLKTAEYLSLMKDFFIELCKAPYEHRKIIYNRRIETHLTAGPITQHPFIAALPMGPRDHDTGWDVVPGAAATGRMAPTVINIQSLYKAHGSKNLVLHEFAHVLDRFFNSYEIFNFDLSPSDNFRPIYDDTPWLQVYGAFLLPYHKKNVEEHFAELYARWYGSQESRMELRALIPGIEEYFNSLL